MEDPKSTKRVNKSTMPPKVGVYVHIFSRIYVALSQKVTHSMFVSCFPDTIQANKQKVIDALATHDATQRTYIAIRYKELYSKDLQELMKKEFSGNLGEALRFLALRPDHAEAKMIKHATKGIGASPNIIWSIVCGRTNAEIDILKKSYFSIYSKDMSKLLASELHGDMERLVFTCLQGAEEEYNPQFHTLEKAVEDAEIIHRMGQGRWGTDERGIFKIVGASPKEHLQNVSK